MQEFESVIRRLFSILLVTMLGAAPLHADAPTSSLPLGEPTVKPMEKSRSYFGAVPLSDNRILIVGGWGSDSDAGPLRSTEIFDIKMNRFIEVTPSHFSYYSPTLLPLHDGRILAVGFLDNRDERRPESYSPEIYDPQRNAWTLLDQIRLSKDEAVYAAKQNDGTVLLMAYDMHAVERSSRADLAMFRAWVYESWNESVKALSPPFAPRTEFIPIILPTGEILATEGYSAVFEPEYRCEEIPAEYAIAAGEPSGDWCASHGQWSKSRATTTELWNIHSGEVERFELVPFSSRKSPPSSAPSLFVQVLEDGDVLVVRRVSNREILKFGRVAKLAAVWSGKQKRWTEIADFPDSYHLDANNSLQELEAGTLVGPSGKYSLQSAEWEPLEGTGHSGVMVRMPSDRIGLLRMQELYWSELDAEPGALRKDYVQVNNPSSVALDDGRILVIGGISGFSGYELFAQIWDPGTNLWQTIDLMNKTQLPERQLVRMGSGDVLLTGMASNGSVICQRWRVREDLWSNCGAVTLQKLVNEQGMKNPFSVKFRYELGVLDDGRALLVDGPDSAYLYDEEKNRWTRSISLKHNDVPLVSGSPIELPPLYWFADPETGVDIEVSHIVFSFRRRSPAHQSVGKSVTLWDPAKQHWAYIGNKLPVDNYFLPDGCTIGMQSGEFYLFNPATREIHELSAPRMYGRIAVTSNGTMAVVGEPQDGIGFFTRSVSCRGFAGEEIVVAETEKPQVQPPAAKPVPPVADANETVIDKLTYYLDRYRWVLVAIVVPLILFFVIRGIIRKLSAHDVSLPSMPNTSWVVRLVFYGAVGFLFGPMLISQLMGLYSTADDADVDSEIGEPRNWFQDNQQLGDIRGQLRISCHYVGVWQALNLSPDSNSRFRYTFNDDGTLLVHTTEGRTAKQVIRGGYWAVNGRNMVWFDDQREDAPATNFIVKESGGSFTIRQPDGQYTQATRVASFPRQRCTKETAQR